MFKKDLPVYIALIFLLFVAIFALTACVGNPHSTHSLSNPSMTPLKTAPSPDQELFEVVDSMAGNICELFNTGGVAETLPMIFSIAGNNGVSDDDVVMVIEYAVLSTCPQYQDTVDNLLN